MGAPRQRARIPGKGEASLWTQTFLRHQVLSSSAESGACTDSRVCSQSVLWVLLAHIGKLKGCSKRLVGQRGDKCLFFLIRKGEAAEWKSQHLIPRGQDSSASAVAVSVVGRGRVDFLPQSLQSDLFICLLHCDFLLSAFQYPSRNPAFYMGVYPGGLPGIHFEGLVYTAWRLAPMPSTRWWIFMPTPGRVISKKTAQTEYIPKRKCFPLVLGSLLQAVRSEGEGAGDSLLHLLQQRGGPDPFPASLCLDSSSGQSSVSDSRGKKQPFT